MKPTQLPRNSACLCSESVINPPRKTESSVYVGTERQHTLFELRFTYICLLITILALLGFLWDMYQTLVPVVSQRSLRLTTEISVYSLFIAFIAYGNILYQLGRTGYFKRLAAHQRATDAELRAMYDRETLAVTFLIPSYKEEARVIRQALLSAGLQEYPNREVVLLIDDPPTPRFPNDLDGLRQSRELPDRIQALLHLAHQEHGRGLEDYLFRKSQGQVDFNKEWLELSNRYRSVARWFETQAKEQTIVDHTDVLFADKILQARGARYHALADELLTFLNQGSVPRDKAEVRIRQEYQRLASLFDVRISSFERKRYRNLSHEPNKAMNLNSYIGLMGKRLQEVERRDGVYLEEVTDSSFGVQVRDAAYLITLDADSLLLPEYAIRLIYIVESPGYELVGVIQTPYSAIPNPSSKLERIAGAQTDVQFFNHQGSTYYGAAFWVGASAVLRKATLEEMMILEDHHGYQIKKYIRDRTLVEDTDSTADLIPKRWTVYNYPERLAYSATPPDFGTLLVQRARWANGGLLVVPKLLKYGLAKPRSWLKLRETIFRFYYVFALSAVSLGFLIVVAWPYGTDASVSSWWVIPAVLPYCLLYARDLRLAGYQRKGDFFRVYALNLLLVPVNIAGTLKSLHQASTGKKSAFKRTPKVLERTDVPIRNLAFEYGLLVWLSFGAVWNVLKHHWLDATFACINAVFLLYAIRRFIGFDETITDIKLSLNEYSRRRVQRKLSALSDSVSRSARKNVSKKQKQRTLTVLLSMGLVLYPASMSAALSNQAKDLLDVNEPLEPLELAITIDDLPAHGEIPAGVSRLEIARAILAALQARHVPPVYGFSNGQQLTWDPSSLEVLKEWLKSGNFLGNHTFSHEDLAHSTAEAYIADIAAMDGLLAHVAPVPASLKVFRYPFLSEGDTLEKRNAVRDYLAKKGYLIAQVTMDYSDWAWSGAYVRCAAKKDEARLRWLGEHVAEAARRHLRSSQRMAKLIMGRDIRHILLLHVSAFNALILPDVLSAMQADGVKFVDLEAAMSDPIYTLNPNLPMPDGRTFLEQLVEVRDLDNPFEEHIYTSAKLEDICKS